MPWIRKRIYRALKTMQEHEETDLTETGGQPGQVRPFDKSDEDPQAGRGVRQQEGAKTRYDVVFEALGNSDDRLGQQILDWADREFSNAKNSKYLLAWLRLIREGGGQYHGIWTDVAEELGVNRRGISKYKAPMQEVFIRALLKERSIMKQVDTRVDISEARSRVAKRYQRIVAAAALAIYTGKKAGAPPAGKKAPGPKFMTALYDYIQDEFKGLKGKLFDQDDPLKPPSQVWQRQIANMWEYVNSMKGKSHAKTEADLLGLLKKQMAHVVKRHRKKSG